MSDQEIVVGSVIGLLLAALIYVIVNIEPAVSEKTKDSEGVEKDENAEFKDNLKGQPSSDFESIIKRNDSIINDYISSISYKEWKDVFRIWNQGDLLMKIVLLENRKDLFLFEEEDIYEWEKRITNEKLKNWDVWLTVSGYINDLLIKKKYEKWEQIEKQEKVRCNLEIEEATESFYNNNLDLIKKWFELLNKRDRGINDYGTSSTIGKIITEKTLDLVDHLHWSLPEIKKDEIKRKVDRFLKTKFENYISS